MSASKQKKNRVLDIFFRLFRGEYVSVKLLSDYYQVSTKSITRDINNIKEFLDENREMVGHAELNYSYSSKAYFLEFYDFLLSKELVIIMKILVASRSLCKADMELILAKIKAITTPKDRKLLDELVKKELHHYIPVGADCNSTLDNIWKLSKDIRSQSEITIEYIKIDRTIIQRKIWPLAIVFSEFYFYLIARHITDGESVERYYRIDRITEIITHRSNFIVKNNKRFDEGSLKNHIQFMWPGKRLNIEFEFTGPSIQAILDKLPGAEIIGQEGNKYLIKADVYGEGIKMYLLSQGSWVKILKPQYLVEEIKKEIKNMLLNYD